MIELKMPAHSVEKELEDGALVTMTWRRFARIAENPARRNFRSQVNPVKWKMAEAERASSHEEPHRVSVIYHRDDTNEKAYMLEGHGRVELWKRGALETPQRELEVRVYVTASLDEVTDRYLPPPGLKGDLDRNQHIDNVQDLLALIGVEPQRERIYQERLDALRSLSIEELPEDEAKIVQDRVRHLEGSLRKIESGKIQGLSPALNRPLRGILLMMFRGIANFQREAPGTEPFDMHAAIHALGPEPFSLFDEPTLPSNYVAAPIHFVGPVQAAALLTLKLYGRAALPFWHYFSEQGSGDITPEVRRPKRLISTVTALRNAVREGHDKKNARNPDFNELLFFQAIEAFDLWYHAKANTPIGPDALVTLEWKAWDYIERLRKACGRDYANNESLFHPLMPETQKMRDQMTAQRLRFGRELAERAAKIRALMKGKALELDDYQP